MKQRSLNADITSSRVVLFLGAGASQPLGYPPMAPFMDMLESALGSEEQMVLRNMYSNYPFEDGSPGRDLEVVWEHLQEYLTFFKLAELDPNFQQLGVDRAAAHVLALQEAVTRIDAKIRELIFQHYGNPPSSSAVTALYDPLFDSVRELFQQPVLPVFTTNYDAGIETYASEAGVPIEFGFKMSITRQSWDPDRFHKYEPPRTGAALVLFKLHGSVTWYKDGNGVKYVPEAQEGLRGAENMVIYPGDTKVGMLKEPYFTCYTYLRHCLQNAERAIVLGYSFRDPILQLLFQEARLLNPEVQFVIVTDRPAAEMEKRLRPSVGERVVVISQRFEAGDEAPYLQELRALFAPEPAASLEWVGKNEDLVGAGPGLYDPDGAPDGVFNLSIKADKPASVERMDLYRVDSEGNELGERWTTASDQAIWALGVFSSRRGDRLERLVVGAKKATIVKIAASDDPAGETWFAPGQRFKIVVHLEKRPPITVGTEIPADG